MYCSFNRKHCEDVSHGTKICCSTFQSVLVMVMISEKISCRNTFFFPSDDILHEVDCPLCMCLSSSVWLNRLFSVFRLLFVSTRLSNSEQIWAWECWCAGPCVLGSCVGEGNKRVNTMYPGTVFPGPWPTVVTAFSYVLWGHLLSRPPSLFTVPA